MKKPTHEDLGKLLLRARDDFIEATRELRFSADYVPHLVAISLYGTILELFGSVGLLIRTTEFTAVPIVLRTMYEAVVDLRCLRDSPDHLKVMRTAHLRGRERFTCEVVEHPVSAEIKQAIANQDLVGELKEIRKEIDSLDVPKKDTNIRAKFDKAGMIEYYRTVYAALCMDTHNDLAALQSRHLSNQDGSLEVTYFELRTDRDLVTWTVSAIEVLLQATDDIRSILESPDTEPHRNRVARYRRLREEIHARVSLST